MWDILDSSCVGLNGSRAWKIKKQWWNQESIMKFEKDVPYIRLNDMQDKHIPCDSDRVYPNIIVNWQMPMPSRGI